MKELLVASVFSGHPNDPVWLDLQLRQLTKTTTTFDHAVYLNAADERLFPNSIVIGSNPSPRLLSEGHHDAAQEVSRFCRDRSYRHYLIIDSDAFPVHPQWLTILTAAMTSAGKRFAAPIRTENLDQFPHPSVFFTSDPEAIVFELRPSRTLLGREVTDLHAGPGVEGWFPLVKTNRLSCHPVLGSIYFDLFYHHACGSRDFRMRATHARYYDHLIGRFPTPEHLFDELTRDPDSYIAALR